MRLLEQPLHLFYTNRLWAPLLFGVSLVTQAAVLAQHTGAVWNPWLLSTSFVAVCLTWRLLLGSEILRFCLVAIFAGGLGMAAGLHIDGSQHLLHGHHPLISWMMGLMLISCVGGCALLCPRGERIHPSLRITSHVLTCLLMSTGMLVQPAWLHAGLNPWISNPAVSHYVAMMLGMAIGTLVAQLIMHCVVAGVANRQAAAE